MDDEKGNDRLPEEFPAKLSFSWLRLTGAEEVGSEGVGWRENVSEEGERGRKGCLLPKATFREFVPCCLGARLPPQTHLLQFLAIGFAKRAAGIFSPTHIGEGTCFFFLLVKKPLCWVGKLEGL